VIVAVVGVTLELAIMALAGSDDAIRGVRGIGLVGLLSRAIVKVERRRVEAERDLEAAHALRAPVATIRGLVDFLRSRGPRSPEEEKVVLALGDETDRLLNSPLLERPNDGREAAAEIGEKSPT
jgi:signal transduction histidine kinase